MRKKRYTLSQMTPIVSGFTDYQGTKSAYCAKQKISLDTFNYWRKRVKTLQGAEQTKLQSGFIALPEVPQIKNVATSEGVACFTLYFSDGKRLEFPLTTPAEILHTVLQIPC